MLSAQLMIGLAAFGTVDAIGIDLKAQYFKPMPLLFCEKEEWAMAGAALLQHVHVVPARVDGELLSGNVRYQCRLSKYRGVGVLPVAAAYFSLIDLFA